MGNLDKLGSNFKVEVICDKVKVFKADVSSYKNDILHIQLDDDSFRPEDYESITLNLKGNGYNFLTKPVHFSKIRGIIGGFVVSDIDVTNNNRRQYKRIDVSLDCVLEQLGREYNVRMQNVSAKGAKVTLKKSICVLGLFHLKFILNEDSRFNLECKIIDYYVAENNENICLHLQFSDINSDEESKLIKEINMLELEYLRKLKNR